MDRLLEEFLRYEVDDYIRTQLRDATASLTTASRYFTYNAINFRLDADSGTATVEDELDVNRDATLGMATLLLLLGASRAVPMCRRAWRSLAAIGPRPTAGQRSCSVTPTPRASPRVRGREPWWRGCIAWP